MKIALGCALVIACVTMASAQVLEVAGRTVVPVAQSSGPCDCLKNPKSMAACVDAEARTAAAVDVTRCATRETTSR